MIFPCYHLIHGKLWRHSLSPNDFDSFLNPPFNYVSSLCLEYLCHGKTQGGNKKSENITYYPFWFWFLQHPFLLLQWREKLSDRQIGRGAPWPITTGGVSIQGEKSSQGSEHLYLCLINTFKNNTKKRMLTICRLTVCD